jgi:hypothetical protein
MLQFAYNHRPASLANIQQNISSLLHLSPTATQPIAASNIASVGTSSRRSFFSNAAERAGEGHDARDDERVDQATVDARR